MFPFCIPRSRKICIRGLYKLDMKLKWIKSCLDFNVSGPYKHCVKISQIWSFSFPYYPVLKVDTDI